MMYLDCPHCRGVGKEPKECAIQRGGSGIVGGDGYHDYLCIVCKGKKKLWISSK